MWHTQSREEIARQSNNDTKTTAHSRHKDRVDNVPPQLIAEGTTSIVPNNDIMSYVVQQ